MERSTVFVARPFGRFTALRTDKMLISLRSAMLIGATISASSVAPAQVTATTEPMTMVSVPEVPASQPLIESGEFQAPAEAAIPADESATAEPAEPVKRTDLASMVAGYRSSDPGNRQLECLAVGIYFEAKSEPLIGQLAVGEVIANRATSGRFASTYCGVLFQRGQFSFIRGKSLPSVPRASKQWQTAVAIAKIVDKDLHDSSASNALFFHAKRVSPRWRLKRVASIGNHVFYR